MFSSTPTIAIVVFVPVLIPLFTSYRRTPGAGGLNLGEWRGVYGIALVPWGLIVIVFGGLRVRSLGSP
jgi:hypothetical protein